MQQIARIPRRLALTAAGIIGLSLAMFVAVTPARAGNQSFTATINGPATVWDDELCTWTATTNISNPIYEWEAVNGYGSTVIGSGPWVSHAFDKSLGTHQGLHLRVYNLAGDEAGDANLIGIFFRNVGNPDCP